MMHCPTCPFEGTLQEMRAHVTVRARIDDVHADWLATHDVRLDDDTQASVSELTYILSRAADE